MPISVHFDASNLVTVVVDGIVSVEEAFAGVMEVYRDPRFVSPTRVLCDLGRGSVSWDRDQVARMTEFVRTHRAEGRGRTAVLVSDEVTYGLGRMYQLQAQGSGSEVQVFRDRSEALAWLRQDFAVEAQPQPQP